MAKGQKEVILVECEADLAGLCCHSPISVSERVNADIYQELFRPYLVPWVQKTYPDRKYALWQIQLSPTLPESVSRCWWKF
jgi:hypothetical protein